MLKDCQTTHTIETSEGIKAAAYLWPLAAESKVCISDIKHVGWRDIVIIGNYVLSSSMCPESLVHIPEKSTFVSTHREATHKIRKIAIDPFISEEK